MLAPFRAPAHGDDLIGHSYRRIVPLLVQTTPASWPEPQDCARVIASCSSLPPRAGGRPAHEQTGKCRRLGNHDGIDSFIVKPKGMRWRTFHRLMAKVEAAEDIVEHHSALLVEMIRRKTGERLDL